MDIWLTLGIPSVAIVNESMPSLVSLASDFTPEDLATSP